MFSIPMKYIEYGYEPVLLGKNSKVPIRKNWPEVDVSQKELENHKGNIGIKTGEMVAIDIDDKDEARTFYRKNSEILKTVIETRKGAHFWFRSNQEVGNGKHRTGDLRGIGGQVLVPPSEVNGWKYKYTHELVRIEDLPLFDFGLIEGVTQKIKLTRDIVQNLDQYLSNIYSVQGKYGSKDLMRAAYICRDAGLSEAETMIRLVRWNDTNCKPRWSDSELARAVTNAFQRR